MRTTIALCLALMALFGAVAHASGTYNVEKVKTGILPSGGFYSMYSVDCPDQSTGAVASLNDRRGWCTLNGGELNCFSRKQEASYRACMSGAVAANSDKRKSAAN